MALSDKDKDTFSFCPYIDNAGKLRYLAVITSHFDKRYFTDEQKIFMQENPTPDKLSTPNEKVRWHRIKHHLKQDDIADCVGVSRTTYMKFEQGQDIILSPAQYDKLSLLFGVPATELLDEYNKFLYEGQGTHLKAYRKKHRLTQCDLAEKLSIQVQRVKRWEQCKNRMSKEWWERVFKSK